MLRVRVLPALLLRDGALVKTRQFRGIDYVGDPCNTLRIFNELEVDELATLDISATRNGREPDFELLQDIASECFMPLSYGGGIRTFLHAKRIFEIGFEKVIVNSHAHEKPELVEQIAETYGSQAIIASIDVKTVRFGGQQIYTHGGRKRQKTDPIEWAREMERRGAGEILLTAIDREGTWSGPDVELIKQVASAVEIPLIAHGGIANIDDMVRAVRDGDASSVAVGAMVVYQKKDFGVLVNFPEPDRLERAFASLPNDADHVRSSQ